MDFDTIVEEINSEHVLLISFIAVGLYGIYEARNYPTYASEFPTFTAAIVVVLSVLLLFRNYLPEFLKQFVEEDVQVISATESTEDLPSDSETRKTISSEIEAEDDEAQDIETSAKMTASMLPDRPVFIGLVVLYIAFSYLVSLFVATPLFVILYGIWAQLPRFIVVAMTILSVVIGYLFLEFIGAPIDEGVLLSFEVL